MDELAEALLPIIDPLVADLPYDDAARLAIAESEAKRLAPLVREFVTGEVRRVAVAAA